VVSGRSLGFALSSNTRVIGFFDLLLAVVTGWLLWRSLGWPLVGDATIFHFIAGQMNMGAVPYRDIVDINMPLTYDIHAAVVAIGGISDLAWRIFDLTTAAVMSAFAKESGRRKFLAALDAEPPDAILLTNDQWPKARGFDAASDWPEFMALLTRGYDLNLAGHEGEILWRSTDFDPRASSLTALDPSPRCDRCWARAL
jgi:hypothetical protein